MGIEWYLTGVLTGLIAGLIFKAGLKSGKLKSSKDLEKVEESTVTEFKETTRGLEIRLNGVWYRGRSTVWYHIDTGRRASTPTETRLCELESEYSYVRSL